MLLFKPAMRPINDDVVRIREPLAGREDRTRIDHRDAVAQELADTHERRGEVDGAKDEHLRGRCVRRDKDIEALTQSLALGSITQEAGGSGRQHADGVFANRVVEPIGTQASLGAVGANHEVTTDEVRPPHDGCHGDRLARLDAGLNAVELGPRGVVHPFDEHFQYAAAGESDGESVVVADPVGLEPRLPVGQHFLTEFVESTFHAATADGADSLARAGDEHGGAGGSRCGFPGAHHRGHGHLPIAIASRNELIKHLAHAHLRDWTDHPAGRLTAKGQ